MTVFWNGDVTSCIADLDGKCLFGNLGQKSIKEIWNSTKFQHVKQMHKNRNFKGLEVLQPPEAPPVFFARIRELELAAALNRLRSLRLMEAAEAEF